MTAVMPENTEATMREGVSVETAMVDLHNSLRIHDEQLANLLEKLEPVLKPQHPKEAPSSVGEDGPEVSDIQGRLITGRGWIESLTCRLYDIQDRLDL